MLSVPFEIHIFSFSYEFVTFYETVNVYKDFIFSFKTIVGHLQLGLL